MGGNTHADRINAFLDAYAEQLRRTRAAGGDAVARAGTARLLGSKLRVLADGGRYVAWAARHTELFLNRLPPGGDVVARALADDGTEHVLLRSTLHARVEQVRHAQGTR